MMKLKISLAFIFLLVLNSCKSQPSTLNPQPAPAETEGMKQTRNPQLTTVVVGAERMQEYLPLLQNKNVALLVNQTSMVGETHLVDTLLAQHVHIKKIFAPEHGFRGSADAGEHVRDSVDAKTKIKIISLYGEKKKPSNDDLKNVDVMVFDVQDVGARFYTFISTLHYLMEACADNNIVLVVFDRPNPNGWYIDGPVLKKEFQSFVGVDPIPVVHGLTIAEYAQMVNGENWLPEGKQCKLKIISCLNYGHSMRYNLPVKPSPNLPNAGAVYLYPSICFFEGTDISVGRGTDAPFQMIGSPNITVRNFSFHPESKPGAKSPPHVNQICFGYDLRWIGIDAHGINLSYLLDTYRAINDTSKYFLPNGFFDKLAGTDELRKQITAHKTEEEIKASWKPGLEIYKAKRKKYLLYKD